MTESPLIILGGLVALGFKRNAEGVLRPNWDVDGPIHSKKENRIINGVPAIKKSVDKHFSIFAAKSSIKKPLCDLYEQSLKAVQGDATEDEVRVRALAAFERGESPASAVPELAPPIQVESLTRAAVVPQEVAVAAVVAAPAPMVVAAPVAAMVAAAPVAAAPASTGAPAPTIINVQIVMGNTDCAGTAAASPFPRAGIRWDANEVTQLTREVETGMLINEISKAHQRSPVAIEMKMKALQLM